MSITSTNCVYCERGEDLFNLNGQLGMYCKCGEDHRILRVFGRGFSLGEMVEQCNMECNNYTTNTNWFDIEDKLQRMEEFRIYGNRRAQGHDPF